MTYCPSITKFKSVCLAALLLPSSHAFAQGGCGSACLPLESLDVFGAQVKSKKFRMALTWQYAEFDNFRVGDEDITNPGDNSAIIQDLTLFLDYGLTDRLTVSLLLPYIKKEQQTNRFGQRVAKGLGDVSLFGRYEVLTPRSTTIEPGKLVSPVKSTTPGPAVALGIGFKFPTGSIEEPGGGVPDLPPPFQNGTGALDLIGTLDYHQNFLDFSLFGNAFVRLPLEENKRGYKFGNEYEAHFGVVYPLRRITDRVELTLSLDYLHGDHDNDSEGILPPRLRDGEKVLNTGGDFLDVTPGLLLNLTPRLRAQVRVFIPIHENWHGDASRNVGQVAPDSTWQVTFNYLFD